MTVFLISSKLFWSAHPSYLFHNIFLTTDPLTILAMFTYAANRSLNQMYPCVQEASWFALATLHPSVKHEWRGTATSLELSNAVSFLYIHQVSHHDLAFAVGKQRNHTPTTWPAARVNCYRVLDEFDGYVRCWKPKMLLGSSNSGLIRCSCVSVSYSHRLADSTAFASKWKRPIIIYKRRLLESIRIKDDAHLLVDEKLISDNTSI